MTNTQLKGSAVKRITLEWNGTDEDLISLCNELSERFLFNGLDSLDLGDSMGAICALLEESDFDGSLDIQDSRGHLIAFYDWDIFKWERIPD